MRKNFLTINIPKLPVCTTEEGINIIKSNLKKINDWKNVFDLMPEKYRGTKKLKKSAIAGLFSASLELTREGIISMLQKRNFEKLLIKEKNE